MAVEVLPGDEGEAWEYYSCPLLFIPPTVGEFLERKAYMDKHPHTAPSFDDLGERWREFSRYYENVLADYTERAKREG